MTALGIILSTVGGGLAGGVVGAVAGFAWEEPSDLPGFGGLAGAVVGVVGGGLAGCAISAAVLT